MANRTDACFIRVIGSELVQKYVGEGARMVRELFEMARTKKVRFFTLRNLPLGGFQRCRSEQMGRGRGGGKFMIRGDLMSVRTML